MIRVPFPPPQSGRQLVDPSHSWRREPGWPSVCRYCQCRQGAYRSTLPCPQAEEWLARERDRREAAEREEYARMKAERARYEYLHAKYGGQ